MLQSLHIENFRGFQEFDLENLGKINLLVGENNSGKTSLLEAILIFFSHGNLKTILELMKYRGEYLWIQNKIRGNRDREYAIRHLFSLEVADLTQLFDNIVLSPNEQLIIEALQIIEPKIERIASVGQEKYSFTSRNYGERGGFVIKFSDQKNPVPISC